MRLIVLKLFNFYFARVIKFSAWFYFCSNDPAYWSCLIVEYKKTTTWVEFKPNYHSAIIDEDFRSVTQIRVHTFLYRVPFSLVILKLKRKHGRFQTAGNMEGSRRLEKFWLMAGNTAGSRHFTLWIQLHWVRIPGDVEYCIQGRDLKKRELRKGRRVSGLKRSRIFSWRGLDFQAEECRRVEICFMES